MITRFSYILPSFLATLSLTTISYFFIDKPAAFFCRTLDLRIVDIFQWITVLGQSTGYLISFFLLFSFFNFYKHQRRYANRSLYLFVAVAMSGIVADIIKIIVARYRPMMFFEANLYGFDFFRIGHEYNSFPSGHVTTVFSVAAALSLFFPKYRALSLAYALVVSASRVIIDAHYVSDIIAGAYIGVTTVLFLNWFYGRYKSPYFDIGTQNRLF
ncbi:MAG: phosphatase PAP2 family protein [Syntrophus sp. (in: bacteria)]